MERGIHPKFLMYKIIIKLSTIIIATEFSFFGCQNCLNCFDFLFEPLLLSGSHKVVLDKSTK